ncbi:MAG: phosphate ABC transporter ATP-binding protein PstB [Candidatus Micrarchaeia archaeon]
MVDIAIKTENLSMWYGEKQALKNINMEIEKNRITALIGPSGCGKTSFLKCINRMSDLIPNCRVEGKVFVDGENVYGGGVDVVKLRRKVGMVFQIPNPFPKSIYDNVAYGPRIHGIKDKKVLDGIVERSLREAALWDEVKGDLKKSALDLSGGQKQRLCIARALAVEPNILLMDEPCSALDPIATSKIEELIVELSRRYTVVIVTHNIQQAARISNFMGFFYMGELVEYGETTQMLKKPKQELTENYLTGRFG